MAKSKSRATRAGDAANHLSDIAQGLRDAANYEEARKILDTLDFSDVENLRDEITEWKDNIEEKFSATQKYETLSESADALDNIVSELEGLDDLEEPTPAAPGLPADAAKEPKEGESGKVEDDEDDEDEDAEDAPWRDSANSIVDTLEAQSDELGNVEFPGMFG